MGADRGADVTERSTVFECSRVHVNELRRVTSKIKTRARCHTAAAAAEPRRPHTPGVYSPPVLTRAHAAVFCTAGRPWWIISFMLISRGARSQRSVHVHGLLSSQPWLKEERERMRSSSSGL